MKKQASAKEWAELAEKKLQARNYKPLSIDKKVASMHSLYEKGGVTKMAEAMVGPISIRVNYEGISRQALVEDKVERGVVKAYPVLNDLPTAYSLNSNDGEVRISHIEGKQVIPTYGRIAAEWEVDRGDLEQLSASPIQYADNITVQQIMKKEDNLLYNGLDLLIQDWQSVNPGDTSNDITLTNDVLDLDTVIDAQSHLQNQQAEAKNIIASPGDLNDIYRWDAVVAGMQFKDSYFAGYKQLTFGNWNLLKSVTVPKGRFYVTSPADMLGVFATRYGLEQTDDVTGAAKFKIRSIFNELVCELLINRNAVVRIKKANAA